MIKLLGLSLLASVIANLIGETATAIGAVAAGVAGLSYLGAKAYRLLKDVHKLVRRCLSAYQILEALPSWMHDMNDHHIALDQRLDRLEATTTATQEPAEAIARDLGITHRQTAA
jgi:hypothetical protein